MKEPKTFNRPRMYAQFEESTSESTRIRIIYPDGRSVWDYIICAYSSSFHADFPNSCWSGGISGPDEVRRMREYDEERGFPKAVFLGEL